MTGKDVEDVELTPPDAVQNAAQAALDFEDENDDIQDCGTGVGDMRAEQIVNNDLEPEDFLGGENTAIPDYLDSHSEDVTADGPATGWSNEEMNDCGNRQYAKWGGVGTGTGLEWAQSTEKKLQDAMEDEDENNTMTESHDAKDYQYDVGDFVSWEFGDGESQGEIIDKTDEEGDSLSAGGNEFTVEEDDEALYKIQEWDEEEGEEGEFTNNVVKFERALSSANRPEAAPESAPRNNSSEINRLSQEELKEISEKAGTEEAPKVHKSFQLNSKDIKQGEDENGNPVYKVPISGDARDRDQDQMDVQAQESMTDQLRSGKIPVYGDHGRASNAPRYSFTNILGQFIDGELSAIDNQERNEGEKVTMADMRLRTSHPDAKELEELLEGDWPVGFSVGFIPTEVEEITNDEGELTGLRVMDLDLMEASAVGIPSQPDSVPVGISQNSTQAAVAMKSVLDKAGKEVDIDELEKSLNNVIGDESMEQNNEEEPEGSDGTEENSSFAEENRKAFKTLIKESIRELRSEDLEKELEKAPENVSDSDIKTFFVNHFNDLDMEDLNTAVDSNEAEYIGQLDLNAYANLLATAYDIGEGEAQDILEQILDQLEDMDEEGEHDEEDEEENESDPGEEDEMDEDEDEEENDPEELDEEDMTDPDKSTGPDGSGPIQRADGEEDEKDDVELSDELDEEEIEDLSFGGRP